MLLLQRLGGLAGRVTTPLLPSDYLDALDPLLSGARPRGRIVAVHPQTPGAVTLVIRPGRGWVGHRPGQYVRVGVRVDGVRHWRSYSLTSRTGEPTISITVKAVPGGLVSTHLVGRAAVGDVIDLDPAAGDFTLPAALPPRLLFVTAGSGITPVMGMLRNLPTGHRGDIVVVHSAPTAAETIFGGELRMLARSGRIRLIENHTRHSGRLDITRLSAEVPDLSERHTWACGPEDFLDTLESHWAATGLAERLRTERFGARVLRPGDGGAVTFSRSAVTTEATGARSLLEAGEDAGVLMPSGCRMGICFGCVAPLRRGAVRDLRTGTLTTAGDSGDGVVIQTCVSGAAGDCEIDL